MRNRVPIRRLGAFSLAAVALVALSGCSLLSSDTVTRDDESGEVIEGGQQSVFSLSVGDCWNVEGDDENEIYDLPLVPCAEPHDLEIIALFDLPDGEFPGEQQVEELAIEGCNERFEGYVGVAYEESELEPYELFPSPGSWDGSGDREVICSVYHPEEALTGTVKGSQR